MLVVVNRIGIWPKSEELSRIQMLYSIIHY